ncbi:MAG TPA: GNAT family N-acetyltransferase [Rhizomicrobium sp.]
MSISLTADELQALNLRLLGYLRASALRGRNHERIGPFLATFNARDDNVYVNYAIPDDGVAPGAGDIAALIAAFAARQRTPRLEYIAAAAPDLEAALIAAGFVAEARVPVMICRPGLERPAAAPGFDVFAALADADLIGAEQAQAEAYGGPSRGPGGLRRTLKYGGVVAAARDVASGVLAGAGTAQPPIDGISEITGIGVAPDFRKRGIAGAITALLTSEAFAKDVTLLWLTPGGKEAERIYARAGFAAVSEALHISR